MARKFDTIEKVNMDKQIWKLAVRVNNVWSVVNKSKQQHLEMVLMDAQCNKIQLIVPTKEVHTWSSRVKEENTYMMQNFNVKPNDLAFKACDHSFKLVVNGGTTIKDVNFPEIPYRTFQFKDFSEILNGKYREDLLVDIIGAVHDLIDMKINGSPKKVSFIMKDISGNLLQCTLWEDYAEQFIHYQHNNSTSKPIIILLNLAKIKPPQEKFNQPASVSNAWNGTKLFINENMPEIQDYLSRFPIENLPQTSSQLMSQTCGGSQYTHFSNLDKFLYNAQPMTLYEMNRLTKETVCVTLATTVMILVNPNGWTYPGCPQLTCSYSSTLQDDGRYKCKCGIISDNTVPRYKVEMKVIDKQEEINLMFWNPHVVGLLGVTAADLKEQMLKDGEDDPKAYPELLDELLGRQLALRLRVKPGNKMNILAVSEEPTFIQAILPLLPSQETSIVIKGVNQEPAPNTSLSMHSSNPAEYSPNTKADQRFQETPTNSAMADHDPSLPTSITPSKRNSTDKQTLDADCLTPGLEQLSSNKSKKVIKKEKP